LAEFVSGGVEDHGVLVCVGVSELEFAHPRPRSAKASTPSKSTARTNQAVNGVAVCFVAVVVGQNQVSEDRSHSRMHGSLTYAEGP
jgi:hypothetical protein